ncbi:uncharacterized protein [Henckelia pumila]|uniref:uncharacterized protein n=1 Tax=Henckelia pumila TaxID=405737 RepID=UPI003C6DDC29
MGDRGTENNLLQKMEKRIEKKSKKVKTGKESVMGLLENFGRKVSEHEPEPEPEQRSQVDDVTENTNHRKNKGKKASKEVKDAKVVDMAMDSSHGQLIGVCGEEGSGDVRNQEKRKKKKSKIEECYLPKYDVGKLEANEVLEKPVEEKDSELKSGKGAKKERKKKKLMEIHNFGDREREYDDREQGGVFDDNNEGGVTEKVKGTKRKRGRTNSKDDYCIESQVNCAGAMESKIFYASEENKAMKIESKSKKMCESIVEDHDNDFSKKVKRKKKAVEAELKEGGDVEKHEKRKKKNKAHGNEGEEANKGEDRKAKPVVNDLDDPTPSKSNKKVSFSGQDEIFPLSDNSNTNEMYDEENLVRGKRFTPEENEMVKAAVYRFIENHNLGDDGLDMVLNSKKYPELRGCWKEIGAAIPYRPYIAVYFRAQIIFRRSATRKWTQEEYDMVLKYQEVHGNEWKALAEELGKHRWHVKDAWRRIKLRNTKKGHWSQKEYQNLFDLVNIDLQQKLSEEKRSKHGMLRDNISWTAISDKLSTRAQAICCMKWYNQLTSPMVAEGLWADSDDYRLLQQLYHMDAGCIEDVDWDFILDHRSGGLCLKRWNQMVMHIGKYRNKPFSEQVDVLAKRYCPKLLEAREIWDDKPIVP